MRVLVTGGKGDLGRRLVPKLEAAGHDVLVGTRRPRAEGEVHYELGSRPESSLLAPVDVIVHLASDASHPEVDGEGSSRLWAAAQAAAVDHAVYISIVGIDHHPFRYYQAKRRVEEELERRAVPHSILRTTQFHSFVPRLVEEVGSRLRFVPVPAGIRVQPVDPEAVAEGLAGLVEKGPSGRVRDMAGPDVLSLEEIVDRYLQARGRRWRRIRLPLGGKTVAAFRQGLHLADPEAEQVGRTYGEFLEDL